MRLRIVRFLAMLLTWRFNAPVCKPGLYNFRISSSSEAFSVPDAIAGNVTARRDSGVTQTRLRRSSARRRVCGAGHGCGHWEGRRRVHAALPEITTIAYDLVVETRWGVSGLPVITETWRRDPREDVTPPLHGNFGSFRDRQTHAAKTLHSSRLRWRGSRCRCWGRKQAQAAAPGNSAQAGCCPLMPTRTCVVETCARSWRGACPGGASHDPAERALEAAATGCSSASRSADLSARTL